MRTHPRIRQVGAGWLFLLVLGAGFSLSNPAAAQRFPPDPVEGLQRILKKADRDPAERKQLLTQQIEKLRTISDLRRALPLQEWRDDENDERFRNVDEPARLAIARRLEAELRAALLKGSVPMQVAAADMLADIGVSIKGVGTRNAIVASFAPQLVELIKQGSPPVRAAAARALGVINPDPKLALPALAELLKSSSPTDRRAAARALGDIVTTITQLATRTGSATGVVASRSDLLVVLTSVIPVAASGLQSPDSDVRSLCGVALKDAARSLYKQVETRTVDEVIDLAEYKRQVMEERQEFMPVLQALRQAAPAFQAGLQDSDREVKINVLEALENLGLARLLFYRRLEGALFGPRRPVPQGEQGEQEVRHLPSEGLLVALRQPAPIPAEKRLMVEETPIMDLLIDLVPYMGKLLNDPDRDVRLQTLDVLEELGPFLEPIAPAIVKSLSDPAPFVRWAATRTMGKAAPLSARTAIEPLARLTGDQDLDLCLAAATALEHYGPLSAPVLPVLISRLKATDAELRLAIIRAIVGVGRGATPAIPALTATVADPDARVRKAAAQALGNFGGQARSAIPALEAAANDTNIDVRKAASDAILSILPPVVK